MIIQKSFVLGNKTFFGEVVINIMRYKCDCSQLNAQMSQVIGADKQTFTKQVCIFNNTLKKDHKYWLLCFVYLYRVFRPEKLSGNLIYVFNLRSVKPRMTSIWSVEVIKEKIWKLERHKKSNLEVCRIDEYEN